MIAIQLINLGKHSRRWCFVPLLAACLAVSACSDRREEASEFGALAQSHLQNGNIPAAQQAIRSAISARDDVVELQLLRGRIELAAESTQGAYDAYSVALSLDPVNAEALQGVSQLGLSTGNLDQSLDATDRILSISPNQPNALLVRGLHELVRRRFGDAVKYADRLSETGQMNENARILKSRALFLDGDTAGALAQVALPGEAEAIEGGIAPSETIALTRLEIFREARDADRMAAEFLRLKGMRPQDVGLRLDEANFYYRRGRTSDAAEYLAAALSKDDVLPDNAIEAVKILDEYGSDTLNSAQWRKIGQESTPDAVTILARYLLSSGNLPAANILVSSLEGALGDGLSSRLQALEGRHDAAIKAANRVLAKDATNCDALIGKSVALLGKNDAENAVKAGQQASAECPQDIGGYFAAAKAYDAWERPAATRRLLGQALSVHPQNFTVARTFADWLVAAGEGRSAVAIMRRYTRDTPSSQRGWAYYADLCAKAGAGCEREGRAAYASVADRYGIDLPTGQLQPNGLFGRFVTR